MAYEGGGQTLRASEEVAAQEAIEELVASYGIKGVLGACLRSSAGEHFSRSGGNESLRIIQVIIRQIVFEKNPQLEAEIIALGAGIILDDKITMRRIAAKHGLTVAAVSKRVIAFNEANSLPPSQYMRAEKDRAIYAACNKPRTS